MNEPQIQQPQKKGLSPLAWIAIGCVGLILVGVLVVGIGGFFVAKKGAEIVGEMQDNPAKSMAEMAIKMNPDTKFISADDESVTFETKEGEVVTMNFEDIRSGKFSMTSDDGRTSTFSVDDRGVTGTTEGEDGEQTNFNVFGGGSDTSNVPDQIKYPGADSMTTMVASKGGGKWSGMLNYTTDSSMDEVVEWQTEALDECDVTRTDVAGIRNATFTCGGDSITLTFMGEDGSLTVTTSYSIDIDSQ